MLKHVNNTFRTCRVQLDGQEFRGCKFIECAMVYSGGPPPILVDCLFLSSPIHLEGSAVATISFLRGVYRGMGAEGVQIVEEVIEQIRGKDPQRGDQV